MKTGEVIQRIQSLYSKGVHSDDSRLTSRHIYNKMKSLRTKLLSQKLKKRPLINQWNYQTLSCVELVKSSIHECDCLPCIGCEILRTKYPLPKPLINYETHSLQSVTSLDGSIVYSFSFWKELKYRRFSKYTSKKPYFFIKNGYLFITQFDGPKIITITGLFEDPIEANNFPSYCGNIPTTTNCLDPYEADFPIDDDLVDTMIEISVNELIILFNQNVEDITNNTKDENQRTK